MYRADGRRPDVAEAAPSRGSSEHPARVLSLQSQDQSLDLERKPVGLPVRPAAAIARTGTSIYVQLGYAGLHRSVKSTVISRGAVSRGNGHCELSRPLPTHGTR